MSYFTDQLTAEEQRIRATDPARVLVREFGGDCPPIVALCGSTRFRDEFARANRDLTSEGHIVLAPGVFGHSGDPMTDEQKQLLDDLHRRKIDLADSVYVVNPGGYVGASTRSEIAYAAEREKPITYLEPVVVAAEQDGGVSR
ncbi:hypothetical protein AB0F17_08580 [Nonomuraea sp. NPDC026600]|uniref:hypothetical protein n=1 Tax=Nonomuraea sp. NPDC026600 TaxID=3155363 RepID=UPI0033F0CD95